MAKKRGRKAVDAIVSLPRNGFIRKGDLFDPTQKIFQEGVISCAVFYLRVFHAPLGLDSLRGIRQVYPAADFISLFNDRRNERKQTVSTGGAVFHTENHNDRLPGVRPRSMVRLLRPADHVFHAAS